jgi:hypothetical protein
VRFQKARDCAARAPALVARALTASPLLPSPLKKPPPPHPQRFLVYGRTGWIGGLVGDLLASQGATWEYGTARLEDRAAVLADFERVSLNWRERKRENTRPLSSTTSLTTHQKKLTPNHSSNPRTSSTPRA